MQGAINAGVPLSAQIVRIPRNGAAATLLNDPGENVLVATTLGGKAYCVDDFAPQFAAPNERFSVRGAPLQGGATSTISSFVFAGQPGAIGVTSSDVFLASTNAMYAFPISTGVGDGGLTNIPAGSACQMLTSDTSRIYCAQDSGSNLVIGDDGAGTALGAAVDSSYVAFDDTYVYWVNQATVGTIMRAPKAGGPATIIARDTSPTAIAVDARSVYWSDVGGYIKSLPK
jgi:hypothetical protein